MAGHQRVNLGSRKLLHLLLPARIPMLLRLGPVRLDALQQVGARVLHHLVHIEITEGLERPGVLGDLGRAHGLAPGCARMVDQSTVLQSDLRVRQVRRQKVLDPAIVASGADAGGDRWLILGHQRLAEAAERVARGLDRG